ncbi:tyrosinase family oxidase copper chaperone [Nitrosovibrio sp. Nv4]|uniref:tyrosinase family oxidase copper chaperone n=1 Tax=Nitrosovibrio sp. Nv4 TaxID=1945880 RepID=UPI000BD7EB92|nr:tyrosinase family oxidase copper chaperone [Nitrosovibrio sp. Nv4]SOD42557.1 Tyrosinase co-factor MelC1 [Nitrosovibrio sp. Nv4]
MAEQRENYRGREIIVRSGEDALTATEGRGPEGLELFIEGEKVFMVRNAAGAFIASGLAFDPQPSPMDLAKKIIDSKQAGE